MMLQIGCGRSQWACGGRGAIVGTKKVRRDKAPSKAELERLWEKRLRSEGLGTYLPPSGNAPLAAVEWSDAPPAKDSRASERLRESSRRRPPRKPLAGLKDVRWVYEQKPGDPGGVERRHAEPGDNDTVTQVHIANHMEFVEVTTAERGAIDALLVALQRDKSCSSGRSGMIPAGLRKRLMGVFEAYFGYPYQDAWISSLLQLVTSAYMADRELALNRNKLPDEEREERQRQRRPSYIREELKRRMATWAPGVEVPEFITDEVIRWLIGKITVSGPGRGGQTGRLSRKKLSELLRNEQALRAAVGSNRSP